MKYAFIRQNRSVWPIRIQCRVLRVSVAGYHEHFARRLLVAERRHLSEEALAVHVRAVYQEQRGACGWPRVWRELWAQGIRVGKQRVQRLMQCQGLRARGKKRFRVVSGVNYSFRSCCLRKKCYRMVDDAQHGSFL